MYYPFMSEFFKKRSRSYLLNHYKYNVSEEPEKYYYRTAGFLREDFNHANGLIREIKIRVVFSTLHFVSRLQ